MYSRNKAYLFACPLIHPLPHCVGLTSGCGSGGFVQASLPIPGVGSVCRPGSVYRFREDLGVFVYVWLHNYVLAGNIIIFPFTHCCTIVNPPPPPPGGCIVTPERSTRRFVYNCPIVSHTYISYSIFISYKMAFQGLKWDEDLEPQWTTDIDPESIKQAIRRQTIQVSFIDQWRFCKFYNIQIDGHTFDMRVYLPVDPHWKTISEVATMQWIRLNTALPVPNVLDYQASRENAIGFEWILMSKVPGKALEDTWISIPWKAKEQLVQEFAVYLSILFKKQLRNIGNIYPSSESKPLQNDTLPEVKRIVSTEFFWGDHIHQNVPRGPFRSSNDWIAARLLFNVNDCKSTLANSPDKEDLEDVDGTLKIIERLRTHLSDIFPDCGINSEVSMLHHEGLNLKNIMVNGDGKLTGVVDWECVSAVPLWKACDYPDFLDRRSREERPDEKDYDRDDSDTLYWEHLMQYELTVLRRFFINEMQRLEPEWVRVFESSKTQRGFDLAVKHCDDVLLASTINEWIDDIASGKEIVGLMDLYYRKLEADVQFAVATIYP